ncbi:hypothetical protein EH221_04100 [bacterium]|nr:MAG: hypothetical protein EH221_04100 [bacterium]
MGIWLLVPEHLRLGTWDLLKGWCRSTNESLAPRLAMQLINESALCVRGIRRKRTLSQKGFEVANGLPFIATDYAIHELLNNQPISNTMMMQTALGKIRKTFGHFKGRLLTIDPHRIITASKRQMIRRKNNKEDNRPSKMAQTFFCLDSDTSQPVCFSTGTSARSVTQATPELVSTASEILGRSSEKSLVMADCEHYTMDLFDWFREESFFDFIAPMPNTPSLKQLIQSIPDTEFIRHWAGYATTQRPYTLRNASKESKYHHYQHIQRKGERKDEYEFKSFLCTQDRDEVEDLSLNYPERWNIESFFKNYQALGWDRVNTMNLNIQFGRMTMALFAQAASYMMRQKIGSPYDNWDSDHLANDFFRGLEGDIRVSNDTIIVTYYNAMILEKHKSYYQHMPQILQSEGINPEIPWLFNFKIDFKFK